MNKPFTKASPEMRGFDRAVHDVAGVRTVVYSAGEGDPVVYLHGGGTFPGFEFAKEWAKGRRVIIPYHPGFGESDDNTDIDNILDYVVHYIDLFNQLGLESFDLIGHSLGAWIAAEYAVFQAPRIRRLVLAAPNGIVIPEFPNPDSFKIRKENLAGYLTADPKIAESYFPSGHDVDFLTQSFRELTSFSRVGWDCPQGNPKLRRRIHLITCRTLLLWGEQDRFYNIGGSETWLKLLPDATLIRLPDTGHLIFGENPLAPGLVTEFLNT